MLEHHSRQSYKPGATYFLILEAKANCKGFYDDACYHFYLLRLFHSLNYFHVKLHAYLLLPDKLWLLLTPRAPTGTRHLLATVNRAYCDYFNNRFSRRIRRWHNRSSEVLVPQDAFILDCQKTIEFEPVRSGLVSHPGEWRWSSYSTNAFGGDSGFITKHRALSQYQKNKSDPGYLYRTYIAEGVHPPLPQFLHHQIDRAQVI